ncbi:A disintegrin and metalloproteinase with thrombospondin motifs 1-like [Scleropages formosus]|uniref:ADAM metallopeptidase with thrombospondin type 1 motif 1 n=1 Tax=Scleropages formosus TaxID=113540 RepID=A0A8D0CE34_SCLFO|nr:A disintegrin and metalloproteinase with thrombospondin motifs 1-like [Scleropages formosus]
MRRFFLASVFALLCGACGARRGQREHGGAWEEDTGVPLRLDPPTAPGEEKEDTRLYQVDAFGTRFVLELRADPSAPPPGLAPQRCLFSGSVNRDPRSAAALHVCDGLRGGFRLGGDDYLIEPRTVGGRSDTHVVRRRRRAHLSVKTCGVREEEEEQRAPGGSPFASASPPGRRLSRRSVSAPRFVEMLLVADESMVRFHGEQLRSYLLTLVAMASRFYRHPSVRNSISLSVAKVLVLPEGQQDLNVTSNAALMLRTFCQWQQQHNPASDRNPEHYDTAMLFTRQDLCGSHSCNTLGMAEVGTICDPKRSCGIIQDDGLQAGFTLAHELGHVLNMMHDDSAHCTGMNRVPHTSHMMAPILSNLDQQQPWSPCSALTVTSFLDSGHGQCLLDRPQAPQPLPKALPGTMYDAERQCQLSFGKGSRHCADLGAACAVLWCTVPGDGDRNQLMCQTKNFPWADGTPCGNDGRCLSGRCLSDRQAAGYKTPVNGRWGAWGAWGDCSRSCGGGVQYSLRECDNPTPRNGGKYCEGKRMRYRSCNTLPCPIGTGLSFREEQCLAHNVMSSTSPLIPGSGVEWVPKYAGVPPKDRCKLMCRAKGTGYYLVLNSKVMDGTPCSPDSTSVCVQGQCVKAGCDRVIGSGRRLDRCGVCGGDGSTCEKVSGQMERARLGYQDVVTVPAGATELDVKQRSEAGNRPDNSFLAVRRQDGTYLLNGEYRLALHETDVTLQGALLRYSGSSAALERLRILAPLPEPLTIQVLSVGDSPRPRIRYSYFAPLPAGRRSSANAIGGVGGAEWVLREWGACSRSCGGGEQRRDILCLDSRGRPSSECPAELRPPLARPCAAQPCPSWSLGAWSPCSASCGRGFRRRALQCLSYDGRSLDHGSCDAKRRPQPLLALCSLGSC